MTPAELAEMEALCFPDAAVVWTKDDYLKHLECKTGLTVSNDTGFVVGRLVDVEAEIITLGVLPDFRKRGNGTDLLASFETKAHSNGAEVIFLEVSVENEAALALYKTRDFTCVGRRRKYYENAKGIAVDAFILKKTL